MSDYILPPDLAIPSALYIDRDDGLSPENILVMVAAECGCVVETGFSKNQYIIKKPGPGAGKASRHDRTLYCSARIRDDIITVTGLYSRNVRLALYKPDFFDELSLVLNDKFMMISAKDFYEPICNDRVL